MRIAPGVEYDGNAFSTGRTNTGAYAAEQIIHFEISTFLSIRALFFVILIAGLGGGFSLAVAEQRCDLAETETTPSARFNAVANGTVIDKKNNQVWLRCPLEMRWNGSSCEGRSSTYRWREAEAVIDELNASKMAGRSDWRLPTLEELLGIVERRCFQPAANLEVFSFSIESGFWTATVVPGVKRRAMMVHFLHGKAYVPNQRHAWQVRPVAGK